jgi:hypothetical protein
MHCLNRIFLLLSLTAAPHFATANDEFDNVLDDVKRVMKAREARVNKAMAAVENAQLDPSDFVIKKLPHEKMKFDGEPLKCRASYFTWLGKQDGYEYEDCTFTVNIKSDADINGMMLAIAQRTLNGWEIDRNDLKSQENMRPEKIINEEKYRFKRKKQ